MVTQKIEEEFQKNMTQWEIQNCHIVLGVSGGADSVCLLYLCYKFHYQVTAVHVHHGIRDNEADRDAAFVKALCAKWQTPYLLYHYDVPLLAGKNKMSVEEAGRICRYEAFSKALVQVEGNYIAVAHNRNDQAETVIMRLTRGSGLKGLGGIPEKRGQIIRPLLQVKREDIEAYLYKEGISYLQDSTNEDMQYTRNLIRKQVLPLLEQLNANVVEALAQTAAVLAEDEAFIFSQAAQCFSELAGDDNGIWFPLDAFGALPYAIRSRMVMIAFEKCFLAKDVSRNHVSDVLHLCENQSGKQIMLPGNLKVYKSFDRLYFLKDAKPAEEFYYLYSKETRFDINHENLWKATIYQGFPKEINLPAPYTQSFDYDKIKNSLVLRSRKPGDFIRIQKVGRKKLKSFLTEKKIPVFERDNLLLLADGQEIIWVVGWFVAKEYKATKQTANVVTVSIRGG